MKNYIAIVTEENSPIKGQIFATTKGNSKYSNMSKERFYEEIMYNQCYSFEIREIK